ncbi:MAG TPA: AAA family ATPase [Acidimicrobiales bacterium]|nr:AAA family ATPase [Acidimicrobiales bacterium]
MTGVPGSGKSVLAESAASRLGCAVIGHDWTMAGLRAVPPVWTSMEGLGHTAFRSVGWSVMWSLARAQLRAGRSVVLDGVARQGEVDDARALAVDTGARGLVVLTTLADVALHRARIARRRRHIPHWPELTWESVERSRTLFEPPEDVDLVIDASLPVATNVAALLDLLA